MKERLGFHCFRYTISLFLEEKQSISPLSLAFFTSAETVNSNGLSSLRKREKRIGNTIWSTRKMGSRPGNHFYFIWPSASVAVTRGKVDYRAFLASKVDWGSVIASYLGIPLFLCLWLRFKFINKIKVVKLEECEFDVDYASKHH